MFRVIISASLFGEEKSDCTINRPIEPWLELALICI